mmetsp:Transcript_7145/g.13148  ORF Transcript_7145/g.13148 Transcript_7145/m.13148 type:complete len:204 (-) Transcript_7145:330-941(-)
MIASDDTVTLSKVISAWPKGGSSKPITSRGLTTFTPGVFIGISTMVWLSCFLLPLPLASLSRPRKRQISQEGCMAPVIHHLCPDTVTVFPFLSIGAQILVASLLATAGSVMAKQLLISPRSKGSNHSIVCLVVPNRISTSMFPVSGAEQLKISLAKGHLPMISAMSMYSLFDRPGPRSLHHSHSSFRESPPSSSFFRACWTKS